MKAVGVLFIIFYCIIMSLIFVLKTIYGDYNIATITDIKNSLILNEYYQSNDEVDDWGNVVFSVIQITAVSKSKEKVRYKFIFDYKNGKVEYHKLPKEFEISFNLFDYSNKNGRFKLRDKYKHLLK